jgi:hypothetical protein
MPRETFDLHFQQCDHLIKIPLLHNPGDHSLCYICHPELRDRPLPGRGPKCISAEFAVSRLGLLPWKGGRFRPARFETVPPRGTAASVTVAPWPALVYWQK